MKVTAIKCKICNDVVWSRDRHDCHSCKCGKVAIDGGRDYTRILGDKDDYEIKTIIVKKPKKC